ncbi:MAG: ComEC family competence protein [Phreatobacter sp.]|uniref:ComEC/Rec2 family competence protein n=1 Tax=Phreatobacter sp. TaxID=1966341 RepID=UPI001A5016D9|nr:ComEC/Rec2 family competence protein [Phreatobacter sp.]MBL8569626.1 ComEC family competence protein [Phreatobacter sp.]
MRGRARAIAAVLGTAGRPAATGRAGLAYAEARERLAGWLALEVERGRAFLFLPVAFGIGILIYFGAPDEPTLWAPALAAIGLGLLAMRLREYHWAFLGVVGLAAMAAGFGVAALRTQWLAHTVLGTETAFVRITAWVEVVERRENGDRLTLAPISAEPALAQLPSRIRVTSRTATGAKVGQAVVFSGRLRPPADPAAPGLFDFGRDAYFAGVGATGFAVGRVTPAEAGDAPLGVRMRATLDRLRSAISERIRAAIPGHAGAIADALVSGKRDGIPEGLNEAMRAAGLYHILSISGFHMALVAALIFAVVRGGLALVPALALRRRVKAWAAFAALLASTAYLVISGAEVATQRSWLMIAVVLIGVMLDRGALTLRTLALAALAVLILLPESLLGPSFQMSFAATLALVSGYTMLRPWAERHADGGVSAGRALLLVTNGVAGLAMSSFVASLATTPYSAYHFNAIQFYGVPGNLLGAPIIEFFVMPLEILALLLWPFGWDRPVWALAGLGVELFIKIAEWVASWPGGKTVVPSFGPSALGLMSAGFILMAALSTPLRWFGVPLFAFGMALVPGAARPSIMIDAEGFTVAARGADGRMRVVSPRGNRFTVQRWLSSDGDARIASDNSLMAGVRCDALGCAMPLPEGGRIAVPRQPEAVADDCREARIVVTRFALPANCRALIIDTRALAWTGAVRLFREGDGYRVETARAASGTRPWFRPRPAGAPVSLLQPAAGSQSSQPAQPATDDEAEPPADTDQ